MKYTFACKRVPLNDSIKEYAQKKISKLERYFREEDTTAFVTFSVEKDHLCSVEITIRGGATLLRAQTEAPDGDMRGAIDAAVGYIERQILKNKTRLARRENGQFQICGSDWIADFGDPISFLELLTSKNSSNYGSWKNSQYDKLIAASKNTNDQEKRLKDMSKAESILLDDVGVYYEDDAWLIRSNAKGWICKRSEWNFKEAYVTK